MAEYKIKKEYAFSIGEQIQAEDGESFTITGYLGHGGQGDVYRVRSRNGSEFALKWYHADTFLTQINKTADAFYRNLVHNVENGIPRLSSGDAAEQFIWPMKMIRRQRGSFGYLMKIFPSGYVPFGNMIMGQMKDKATGKTVPVRWSSWFARVTAALNIVRAFEILHASGLSYQDVNEGGFAIDPVTGNVLICDCDNVSPDLCNLGILGIKPFMAPEVVRREKRPNRGTDEYSLAVILFRLFLHGHPMIGQESHYLRSNPYYHDNEIDKMIFGTQPHYCLASKNNVNPVDPVKDRDVLAHCFLYPMVLMNAFEQVFTEGVNDVSRRLTATEWRKVLTQVRDQLIIIDGKEQFFGCRKPKPLPEDCRILCYPKAEVLCMPGKILYEYHFDMFSGNFHKGVGKIISTNRPGYIGLLNESGKPIHYSLDDKSGVCEHGHRIPLLKGMVLKVNQTKITVK